MNAVAEAGRACRVMARERGCQGQSRSRLTSESTCMDLALNFQFPNKIASMLLTLELEYEEHGTELAHWQRA